MEQSGRTVIASIVFVDIVGYSKRPVSEQLEMKVVLNDAIRESTEHVADSDRIMIDTGDGAAICFFGDPEDALFAATSIAQAHEKLTHYLRVGVNLGPIKVVTDVNGRPNVVGDGINVAQRVMDFAADGEVLVSRSYHEVVARLRQGNERLFTYIGTKKDKHVREHQIYAYNLRGDMGGPKQPKTATPQRTEKSGQPSEPISAGQVEHARRELSERIGPLADVIVRRAANKAASRNDFYERISTAIPDADDRATFIADAGIESGRDSPSQRATPYSPRSYQPEDLEKIEHALAECIGPLAKILVKQAAASAVDRRALCASLADRIQDPEDRRKFLDAVAGY